MRYGPPVGMSLRSAVQACCCTWPTATQSKLATTPALERSRASIFLPLIFLPTIVPLKADRCNPSRLRCSTCSFLGASGDPDLLSPKGQKTRGSKTPET